ncbi:Hsp20/alpha crystallin family protein [Verrucomicrobiales bacterium]|jgi:HSP20 family molecular chaperone IbpA|nr:Hsp20/alpha crystallin family protein [Verrucomicrobiales bacterium]MDC0314301.1 Hsp20/alpha crystallin family protein [bacterium]
MSRNVRLTRIIRETGEVAFELGNLQFAEFHPTDGWRPDINAYRYDDRIELWVDLAGVKKDAIAVDVLPDRVRISGERRSPAPTRDASSQCRQVIAMEIENGRFAREIVLPLEVDRDGVSAKQENGLLWIILPTISPEK